MSDPKSLDEILAAAENPAYHRVAVARILLRKDLLDAHEALEGELSQAIADDRITNREPVAPEVARRLRALEDEIEATKVPFKFRQVGHKAWADLMARHPPTRKQLEQTKGLDHNPATFPVAALAASCVEPEMTEDHVRRLEAAIDESQFATLWGTCLKVNVGAGDSPNSQAAGVILRLSGAFESTPESAESLDPGSLDG